VSDITIHKSDSNEFYVGGFLSTSCYPTVKEALYAYRDELITKLHFIEGTLITDITEKAELQFNRTDFEIDRLNLKDNVKAKQPKFDSTVNVSEELNKLAEKYQHSKICKNDEQSKIK